MEKPTRPAITLFSERHCGGVIVEALLTLLERPYTLRDTALFNQSPSPEQVAATERLAAVNPLRQVPTLVLGGDEADRGGLVMTESAAILIGLADLHPGSGLAPAPTDPARAAFLRWMFYIPGQIYPMFWVRDVPSRLAGDDPAQQALIEARTEARIAECWAAMEAQIQPSPWLAGETLTVLDLYVTVVSRWVPRRRRFYEIAPKMGEVVRRVDAYPRLQALWAERFPFKPGWEG